MHGVENAKSDIGEPPQFCFLDSKVMLNFEVSGPSPCKISKRGETTAGIGETE